MDSFSTEEAIAETWDLTYYKAIKPVQSFLWENDLHFSIEDKSKNENSEHTALRLYKSQLNQLIQHLQNEKPIEGEKKVITLYESQMYKLVVTHDTYIDVRLAYIVDGVKDRHTRKGFRFHRGEKNKVIRTLSHALAYGMRRTLPGLTPE